MSKILVADDEAHIREVVNRLLASDGHEVIEAEDGGSALELAYSENPDVIVLDVTMPVMDGFEVMRGLKENVATESTPVILLTTLDAAIGEQPGIALGSAHYIEKPLDVGVIRAAINIALRESSTVNEPVKMGQSQLDAKLGGGIPLGSLTLIEGSSSAGKSVLCQHLIHGALQVGHRVACFTSEDSTRSLISQMGSIGLSVSSHLREGDLTVFPTREPGPKDEGGALLSTLAEQMERIPDEIKLITVDSITNIASVSEEHAIAGFFSNCKRLCGTRKTIILVVHSFALDEKMLIRLRSLCDAHLRLTVETMGERQVRVMEVCKIHNANQYTGNVVSFDVEPGFGMKIIPISKAKA